MRVKLITILNVFVIFISICFATLFSGHGLKAEEHHYDDMYITNDYRVKTYVYNPNEVYLLVIHYGFQSYVEFAKGEIIKTITLGDTYSWNINSVDNRLFVKALEKYIQTNMTIITNKRIYQFDLVSKELDEYSDRDLVYVIRFNYIG